MRHFLVVVDMQNDFIDGSLGTKEAIEILPAAVKKIKEWDDEVFITYDTHTEDYLNTAEGAKLPVEHCIKGTAGWELHPEITEALKNKNHTIVEKGTFGSVDLPRVLECIALDRDFDVTLIGLCTDICVVSNALIIKAHYPEKQVSVDSACCAGVTPETHKAALETMKMCQINVL